MKLNQNCKHFITDRPCSFHKEKGFVCENCIEYIPIKTKILIVKLDAIGDVLRTTFILPLLIAKYENPEITWIVSDKSRAVLENNQYINEIWTQDDPLLAINLATENFDVLINVDLAIESLRITGFAMPNVKQKFGFTYECGKINALSPASQELLDMSMSDVLKRKNKKTYQQLIADICDLKTYQKSPIIVPLTKDSINFSEKFKVENKVDSLKKIVGFNVGSGNRWKTKRWNILGWQNLADILISNGYQVLVFAGPHEKDIEQELLKTNKNIISTGSENSIENFFGLLNLVDFLVTSDTMAMHAALGLGKKIVAFFGPTSATEIEMYDNGAKINPNIDCLTCYRTDCSKKCIDNLKAEEVYESICDLADL